MKYCTILVCVFFGVFIVLAGEVTPGGGPLHAAAGKTCVAASDTVKSKIKEKEEELSKKIKKKRDGPDRKTEETRYEEISEHESSFWGSCLGDLLGSICGGMVSSALDGDDGEPTPDVELEEPVTVGDVVLEAPVESGPGAGGMDSPNTLPYTATVMPVSAGDTTVLLWDRPGGEAMQATVLDTLAQTTVLDTLVHAAVLDTLAMGAEVSVIKISQIGATFWVKVVTTQEPRIIGWIREKEASPIEMPDTRK